MHAAACGLAAFAAFLLGYWGRGRLRESNNPGSLPWQLVHALSVTDAIEKLLRVHGSLHIDRPGTQYDWTTNAGHRGPCDRHSDWRMSVRMLAEHTDEPD